MSLVSEISIKGNFPDTVERTSHSKAPTNTILGVKITSAENYKKTLL